MPRAVLTRVNAGSAVLAFGALVLVLLWLSVAVNLQRERVQALGMAQADTANLARAVEEHIRSTVTGLDQTLLFLRAEYLRDPANFSLRKSQNLLAGAGDARIMLSFADAQGILQDSTLGPVQHVNISDREYFRVQKNATKDELFISQPMVGRVSGMWVIMLTRRVADSHGRFLGTLSMAFDTHYLSGFYASLDLGEKGGVLVLGRDGVVRAGSDEMAAKGMAMPAFAKRIFDAGVGDLELEGPYDSEVRISSFRALRGLPLAVWVGRSKSELLARHAAAEHLYLMAGLGVTILVGTALLLLVRVVRRQETIAHDLAVKKGELTASRERLRRYVADLERIAEVAAHDLQEPLRRVVAYAQLLSSHAQNALDAESRDYVAHVVAGAHRMRKLVKDLEAFVAVDNLPAPVETVSARASFNAASDQLGEEIRRVGATLLIDELPDVAIDEKSLTEIFVQLLDNALRYRHPDRRSLVHVSAQVDDGQAVFSVHDNGIGIDESHLARAFEIFHRLPGLDGRKGTGMGLAIVRRMVERHGGRVWVETQAGAGSTFSFSLPVTIGHHDGQEAQAA